MLIVYASKTGNVERFIKKLKTTPTLRIKDGFEKVVEKCIFITYTTGIGEVPEEVMRFFEHNHKYICGICSSGNRNWGSAYGRAADILSNMYSKPVLLKFELSGRDQDVQSLLERMKEL